MTMDSGLYRMELIGLAGLARSAGFPKLAGLPGPGANPSARPETAPGRTFTPKLAGLLIVLMTGIGAWMLLFGDGSSTDEGVSVPASASSM
jgi:hypothetical protein